VSDGIGLRRYSGEAHGEPPGDCIRLQLAG
jgi:hypothetical protein